MSNRIDDYSEKKIRNTVINKIKPKVKPAKHDKGYIYLDKKIVAKVKLPNEHMKVMKHSKSKFIASSLRLTNDEFNRLIYCPITGPIYYDILRKKIKI